jgi:hypothetical protein
MAKKQTKADKAFIEKIGTIGINTGGKKPEPKTCPDCGHEMKPIGHIVGEVHGELLSGPVYGHAKPPGRRRAERPAPVTDEQSFSA